jgi:hypothetical protein
MIRPLLLAAVGAVSIALAAPAHADPDSDYLDTLSNYDGMNIDSFAVNGQSGYLDMLSNYDGMNIDSFAVRGHSGAQMLTALGRAACGELRQGDALGKVANDLVKAPGFNQKQAGDALEAAQLFLC